MTLVFMLSLFFPAWAQTQDYPAWLAQMEADAVQDGIRLEIVHQALDEVMPDAQVVELDQRQPEKTISFAAYSRGVLNKARIQKGRKAMARHKVLLRDIGAKYGVPPRIIVALWGIESGFGRDMGNFNTIVALTTLAYQGRRADFFRHELLAALHMMQDDPLLRLRGSWAGALGQCQFMPSTFEKYAVDYDGDGRRDVWHDDADALASIAHYLAAEGWKAGTSWGREVRLARPVPSQDVGLETQRSLADWGKLGVRGMDRKPLPSRTLTASLIQPDGPDGRSFLVYDNFRALMRWNRSTYFATTVGLLGDRF